ncbi:GGDEF domain-containing protein [Methylobacterium brachythecii]|uniref:diguanylate cyclase n=1 Tax=Methylobacterium brachythecii TaxID=1176177 RepID=A0A7W6AP54_9HYPH|nr:GGDEF domain-containing protein [Methylobacterium brachythecii]MBB3904695.1 diguanylate cyclase (GGDEF)-like protein [Methylobacterium brachythecii]GLS46805.1 GGDEF domain-containing protein [Methylobacterium brachythecii]
MRLDTPTLFLMTVVVTFMVGVLFLLSWSQDRTSRPLAIWGIAHIIGAVASALLCLRGSIPNPLSIGAANALMLAAYGLIWSGVRAFEGRAPSYRLAVSGGLLWLLACLVPQFYASLPARIALASSIAGLFCALCAREILRGRPEPLASRWSAIILMSLYAGLYWIRVPLAVFVPSMPAARIPESPWIAILCFAGVLFTVAIAFVLIAMTKERAELQQRLAAETDSLTGLANRRAFVRRTQRQLAGGQPVALLLFDLDHFKAVNDTYGHAVGDGALVAFSHLAGALLPPDAVLGRLGGEEFACTLSGCGAGEAARIAERVRHAVAGVSVAAYPRLRIGVSVGVAATSPGETTAFDDLMRRADAALYAAKRAGRGRVVVADPSPHRLAA